jgi:hypothetical protein
LQDEEEKRQSDLSRVGEIIITLMTALKALRKAEVPELSLPLEPWLPITREHTWFTLTPK